jgi:hypothetical protein
MIESIVVASYVVIERHKLYKLFCYFYFFDIVTKLFYIELHVLVIIEVASPGETLSFLSIMMPRDIMRSFSYAPLTT